jgi:hypothetical protein
MMKRCVVTAAIALFALAGIDLRADEWHVGPGVTFVSGTSEVVDRYRANMIAEGLIADADKPVPVGVSVDFDYEFTSGLRIGAGGGPFLRLKGSKDHLEFPINGTLGYAFTPMRNNSPYVKAGIVHHFASGDYYKSSTPGFLGAAGYEFRRQSSFRYAVEVSIDRSQVELDKLCAASDASCQTGTVKVRSFDWAASFYVKF